VTEGGGARASAMMGRHGAVIGKVCMALLGDGVAAERALERVAREAATTSFDDGKDALTVLMGLARGACANQLSKMPIRTAGWPRDESTLDAGPAQARVAIGKLRPTEREAVVLHLVGGLDAAQVAEACGIDLATARERIARGVAQLVEEEKRR
jgi:DNA-directed RNA polymerase specialized sigma24 family protein